MNTFEKAAIDIKNTLSEYEVQMPDPSKENELAAKLTIDVIKNLQDWIIEDSSSGKNRDQFCVYFRILWANVNGHSFNRNVDDDEASRIQLMRMNMGFSHDQLAFIFQRSKSTIHDVLRREITKPLEQTNHA